MSVRSSTGFGWTRMENRVWIGALFFLLGTTVGFASVNDQTLQFVPIVRLVSLSVVILILFSFVRNIPMEWVYACCAMMFLYTYGISRGVTAYGVIYDLEQIATSFVVVAFGALFLSFSHSTRISNRIAIGYVLFVALWSVLLIVTGGLHLDFPPRFEFSLITRDGANLLYSQGLSKFYGLAAIFCVWLYKQKRAPTIRALYLATAIGILFLSLLAGGRGDFIAALATCILILAWGRGIFVIISLTLLAVASYFLLGWLVENYYEDFVALRRFRGVLDTEDFGYRDVLAGQAFGLLWDQPECFLLGCGYGYFQLSMGYSYGMYPHNVFLETLLTWGVILTLFFGFLVANGLRVLDIRTPLFWPGVFFVLVSLKSGDVLGSWFALSFFFFLAGRGFEKLLSSQQGRLKLV